VWLIALLLSAAIKGEKDRERVRYGLGLWAPEMRPHWHRLFHDFSLHAYANIWTEWCRDDPQRAWKVMSAVIDVLAVWIALEQLAN
jgi:hypothetical protein